MCCEYSIRSIWSLIDLYHDIFVSKHSRAESYFCGSVMPRVVTLLVLRQWMAIAGLHHCIVLVISSLMYYEVDYLTKSGITARLTGSLRWKEILGQVLYQRRF